MCDKKCSIYLVALCAIHKYSSACDAFIELEVLKMYFKNTKTISHLQHLKFHVTDYPVSTTLQTFSQMYMCSCSCKNTVVTGHYFSKRCIYDCVNFLTSCSTLQLM